MIFTIIIIVAVAGIAFYHYVQGFFSATISAIIALLSAVIAFGLHESVVEGLLGGKAAGMAHAMVLMMLFAAVYLALRIAFDMLVPGNLRLPVTLDKVGAGVMGLVAGIFATGVLAVAAQELPLGPEVAGYARYATQGDKAVVIAVQGRQNRETTTWSELKSDASSFDSGDISHLFPPVDDILIGTVRYLSDGGSLAGSRTLASVHPDLLQELFGQRLGIQVGANRVATNLVTTGGDQVSVKGVYVAGTVQPFDQMPNGFRKMDLNAVKTLGANEILLVVRVGFSRSAADTDSIVRFSTGSARLVAPQSDGSGSFRLGNYYPVGTLEGGQLFVTKPDDFLFLDVKTSDRSADLVYKVDKTALVKPPQTVPAAMPEGSFLEVKRMGRVAMGGMAVSPTPLPPPAELGVMHPNGAIPEAPK